MNHVAKTKKEKTTRWMKLMEMGCSFFTFDAKKKSVFFEMQDAFVRNLTACSSVSQVVNKGCSFFEALHITRNIAKRVLGHGYNLRKTFWKKQLQGNKAGTTGQQCEATYPVRSALRFIPPRGRFSVWTFLKNHIH